MSAGEHNSVLYLAEAEVDDTVEEKSTPRRTGEAGRNQFSAICQWSLAVGTDENPRSTKVTQKNPPHLRNRAEKTSSLLLSMILRI